MENKIDEFGFLWTVYIAARCSIFSSEGMSQTCRCLSFPVRRFPQHDLPILVAAFPWGRSRLVDVVLTQ